MKATKLIIKKHLENALPLLKKFVEDSENEPDLYDDLDGFEINDDDFIRSRSALIDLISQDDYYHMAMRIFQAVILGGENGNDKLKDWELIETVTDLYASVRRELKSPHTDTELLENYLIQLEHYQNKL